MASQMRGSKISQNLSQLEKHYYKPKNTFWLVCFEKQNILWQGLLSSKNFPNLKITTTSPKILYGWFAMKNRIFYGKACLVPKTFPT